MASDVTAAGTGTAATARVHLERDLHLLEGETRTVADLAGEALVRAVEALEAGDRERLQAVVDADDEIDRRYQEIERRALTLLAQHSPVATDLRLVTALIHIALHIERIGDAAANVATVGEMTLGLEADPATLGSLQAMAGQARAMLGVAIDVFTTRDAVRARDLVAMDDELDALDRQIFTASLAGHDDAGRREWSIRMHEASRQLERAGDHAVDIAEQVAFLVTGEFVEFENNTGWHA